MLSTKKKAGIKQNLDLKQEEAADFIVDIAMK